MRDDGMNTSLFTRPSALLPIAMSLAALAIVLGYAAMFGVARQADEGTPAHVWQLLMAGQLPIVAYFSIKWLPSQPRGGAAGPWVSDIRGFSGDVSGLVVSVVVTRTLRILSS